MKPKSKDHRTQTSRNPVWSQQRILDAALKEFAAHGFAGARVDVVARKARINKRMLYHYFGDKKALFQEVLRRKIAERKAWIASAPENPFESLPYWFELMSQDPEWIRLLQWEALQWGERKEVIDERRRKEGFARAVQKIRQQQAEGTVPRELDAAQLLLSLLALTAYPLAFPQIARLATGTPVSSKEFQKQRQEFLHRFGARLQVKRSRKLLVKRERESQ